MNAHLKGWKLAAERLWSAPALDYRGAGTLTAEIIRQSADITLHRVASQAMPSLRAACLEGADRRSKDLARRRFGLVRDCLHALTAPRFGKRTNVQATPEERYRHMLGLPLGRRLFGPEIHQAYKQAAKKVHPDAGGENGAFLELSAARDALMKSI